MSISSQASDLAKIATENFGYSGFDGKKFYFGDIGFSEKDAKNHLKDCLLSNPAIGGAFVTMAVKSKDEFSFILTAALKTVTKEQNVIEVDSEKLGPEGRFSIYRSVNMVPEFTGNIFTTEVPLLIVNNPSRLLMSRDKYSHATFLSEFSMTKKEMVDAVDLKKARLVFDPYRIEFKWREHEVFYGEDVIHINCYVPPKWRELVANGGVEPKIPDIIDRLLKNVFPLEHEREYVLRWVKCAIFDWNQTNLVACGSKGVGKTFFGHLITALVGHDYSVILDEHFLNEKFTGAIYQKRIAIFDETGVGNPGGKTTVKDAIKRLMNARLKYENKGENPFMGENFTSFFMSLNRDTELGVDPDDRRFSIPMIGEKNLAEVIDSKVLGKYEREWTTGNYSDEVLLELAQFGKYLMELDYGDWSPSTPLKGETYYEVTSRSMVGWKRAILRKIKEEGDFGWKLDFADVRKIRDESNNYVKTSLAKIETFLDSYRHMGVKVADVVTDVVRTEDPSTKRVTFKEKSYIVPTKEFVEKYCYKYAENYDL